MSILTCFYLSSSSLHISIFLFGPRGRRDRAEALLNSVVSWHRAVVEAYRFDGIIHGDSGGRNHLRQAVVVFAFLL